MHAKQWHVSACVHAVVLAQLMHFVFSHGSANHASAQMRVHAHRALVRLAGCVCISADNFLRYRYRQYLWRPARVLVHMWCDACACAGCWFAQMLRGCLLINLSPKSVCAHADEVASVFKFGIYLVVPVGIISIHPGRLKVIGFVVKTRPHRTMCAHMAGI